MSAHVMLLFWDALNATVLMLESLTTMSYPTIACAAGEADESALLRGCRELLGVAPISYVALREYPNSLLRGLSLRLPGDVEPFLITSWRGHLAALTRTGVPLVWRHPSQIVAQGDADAAAREVTRSLVSLLFGQP